jgi:hypothetical protein
LSEPPVLSASVRTLGAEARNANATVRIPDEMLCARQLNAVEVLSNDGQEFVGLNRCVLRRLGQKHVGDASETELSFLCALERNGRLAARGFTVLGDTMAHKAVL